MRDPVALDDNLDTWTNYRNRYWPAHYLIDAVLTDWTSPAARHPVAPATRCGLRFRQGRGAIRAFMNEGEP